MINSSEFLKIVTTEVYDYHDSCEIHINISNPNEFTMNLQSSNLNHCQIKQFLV